MTLLSKISNSSLFKTSAVYGGLTVIRQLIPFLLLPVITHYLSPADYGVLAMFNVLLSLFYIFISLNTDSAIAREYFERDTIDFPAYVGNCLLISSISTLVLIPTIYILSDWIEKISGLSGQMLWLILIIGFCRLISQMLLVIWQSATKALSYSAMQIFSIITETALSLFLIIVWQKGLDGRIDAILCSALITSVIAFAILWRNGWLKLSVNTSYIKMALLLGVPMIPHTLGAILLGMSDRLFIMNMLGAAETGFYFLGIQIGGILSMVVMAFNQAWNPWLYGQLKAASVESERKIVCFTYLYAIALTFAALMLWALSPLIFKIMISPEYEQSLGIIGWAAISSIFTGLYYMMSGYIIYQRKTHILSWITISTGVLNIGLTYVLILREGFIGAAQASLIANAVQFVLTACYAKTIHPMSWDYKIAISTLRQMIKSGRTQSNKI